MSMIFRSGRASAIVMGLALAAGLALLPSSANAGFLDQLFGGAPQPSQPSYTPEPAQPPLMSPDQVGPSVPRARKKIAIRQTAPVRQKTTDLMHDKTLRVGDAIMMKDGVHVYNGPDAARHSAKEFVPIDDARHVSSTQRAALVAMDITHTDPLAGVRSTELASGRSVSVDTPIAKGFKITDARGASIRYVGP